MLEIQKRLNPFPGLRAFETDEEHLFFGREDQTDELLRRLGCARFLAVVGTSGSGKSSVVKAGLLPSLYSGFVTKAGSSWRVVVFRPGSDPIGNLARELSKPDVLGSDAEDASVRAIITETTLRRGALGLVEVVRQAKMSAEENLLIVVDQFEELFRLEQSTLRENFNRNNCSDEAAAFVKLLLETTQQQDFPIYVVLTMRSDYLGDCARFRDLPEAINDSQYLIPRMPRDQRRAAIAGPVAVGGAAITPRLVSRLLNDLGDNPDQLPILQHALMRTWDYWMVNHKDGEPIDLRHYKAIGGMAEALSKHADEIYHNLPSLRSQEIAEKLFKCLTDQGPRNLGIRRPTELKEVCAIAAAETEEVVAVVEQFRGPSRSFLMPPEGVKLDENTVLDISHESLIRVWGQLKKWVEEERESARIYRRLAETSGLYKNKEAGLLKPPELIIALNWREKNKPNPAWAHRYESNFERVMEFLKGSKAEYDAEIAKKEQTRREQEELRHQEEKLRHQQEELELQMQARRQQEELRHQQEELELQTQALELQKRVRGSLQLALITAITGLIFVAGLGAFASWHYWAAKLSSIQALSATSEALYRSNQEFDALIEGLRARKLLSKLPRWVGIDTDTKNQVITALQQALYGVKEQNRLERHRDWVVDVSFSPDGQTLASASYDHTVKLWRLDGTLLKTLKHKDKVSDISFSPDGQMLASASWDKTVKLWKRNGTLLKTLEGHNAPVHRISFSPDRRILASTSADKTVKLWKRDGSLLTTLVGHQAPVYSTSFSLDGRTLASASADKTVKLWKRDGSLLTTLVGHQDSVADVSFSPDGQILASASWDKTVRLWKPDGTLIKTLTGHQAPVYRVSFSPDGQFLASASADNTVKLWKHDGTLLTTLIGHSDAVTEVSFSPDGQTLASASYDKTVKLWRRDGTLLKTFIGHGDQVQDVSFSPDSQTLASASADKTVKLWKLRGTMSTDFIGHGDWVLGVSFSPDSQILASTSRDKTVKLWKRDGALLSTLIGHKDWVSGVSFSPDGQTLASASADKTVELWKRDGITIPGHQGPVNGVSFSPNGKILASASADNTVKLWKPDGTLLTTIKGHRGPVNGVSFSPDGQMLASASWDKTVKLWRLDGTLLKTLPGHQAPVYRVRFSPDGQTLASASRDATVKLWKPDGSLLTTLKGHQGPVNSVSFSPDSQIIASASDDNTVRLWKRDGSLLTTLTRHSSGVLDVSFSPNGQTLVSSSNDKTVVLWELPNTSEGWLLDDLAARSCRWLDNYLKTNPTVSKSERLLCHSGKEF